MSAYRAARAEYRRLQPSERAAYKDSWRTLLRNARIRREADDAFMRIMKPQEGGASIFTLAFDFLTAPWALLFRHGFGSDYLRLARYIWMFAAPFLILKILDAPGPAHPSVFVLIVSSALAWWHTLETYNLWNQAPPSWPGTSNVALLFGLGSGNVANKTKRLWTYNCFVDSWLALVLFGVLARVNVGESSLWIDGLMRLYLMAGAVAFIARNFWEMKIIVQRHLYQEAMNYKEQIEKSDLQAKVATHERNRQDEIPQVSTLEEYELDQEPDALLRPEPLSELSLDLQKLLADGLAGSEVGAPKTVHPSETPEPYAVDGDDAGDDTDGEESRKPQESA